MINGYQSAFEATRKAAKHINMSEVLGSETQDPAPQEVGGTRASRHSKISRSSVRLPLCKRIWQSLTKRRKHLPLLRKE